MLSHLPRWLPSARRRFLSGVSTLAGALVLGACGSSDGASPASSPPGPTPAPTPNPAPPGTVFGLQWPGNGDQRRMLYWDNPFPIYDATYVFRVLPFLKDTEANPRYWTTFFWGNTSNNDSAGDQFSWNNGNPDSYYGAHPYPSPPPMGTPQRWEVSVESADFLGPTPDWGRWHTQVFRAWRENSSTTHHEFYFDWPNMSSVITHTVNSATWGKTNPPIPRITMGQSAWLTYAGNEEFKGVIRGIQFYSGLLSLADAASEINAPMSTANGRSLIWYLNLNPRPSDTADKKGVGTPHNPNWRGVPANEWTG